jgi:hypothetical protein
MGRLVIGRARRKRYANTDAVFLQRESDNQAKCVANLDT